MNCAMPRGRRSAFRPTRHSPTMPLPMRRRLIATWTRRSPSRPGSQAPCWSAASPRSPPPRASPLRRRLRPWPGALPSTATGTASLSSGGAAISAVGVGIGIALTVPALVIIATVVAVVYIIQFAEDQSVLPMLQESLEKSRLAPDIWGMASSDEPFNRSNSMRPSFTRHCQATTTSGSPTSGRLRRHRGRLEIRSSR